MGRASRGFSITDLDEPSCVRADDESRDILVRIARQALTDADGRPYLRVGGGPYLDVRDRRRCIGNAQWWWIDDRRTCPGSAEYFCRNVLEPARERAEVAAILTARWQRAHVLLPPAERQPWEWDEETLDTSWPAQTGSCAGVRDIPCTVVVPRGRLRCSACARAMKAVRSLAYYHGKGRETRRKGA